MLECPDFESRNQCAIHHNNVPDLADKANMTVSTLSGFALPVPDWFIALPLLLP